jgi:DNA anti-recombination protein RmuC
MNVYIALFLFAALIVMNLLTWIRCAALQNDYERFKRDTAIDRDNLVRSLRTSEEQFRDELKLEASTRQERIDALREVVNANQQASSKRFAELNAEMQKREDTLRTAVHEALNQLDSNTRKAFKDFDDRVTLLEKDTAHLSLVQQCVLDYMNVRFVQETSTSKVVPRMTA